MNGIYNLTKQLVDGSPSWVDLGDLHGTPWWVVKKAQSSWGHSLPNQEAVTGLLGKKVEWLERSAAADSTLSMLSSYTIEWVRTPWLYESPLKAGMLLRQFVLASDPTQRCYLRELFVQGFDLNVIYRGPQKQSPCVSEDRAVLIAAYSSDPAMLDPEQGR